MAAVTLEDVLLYELDVQGMIEEARGEPAPSLEVVLEHDRAILFRGDCVDVAAMLPDNSIDSIVTDPPAGISFMGKAWDADRGGRDAWAAWLAERMASAMRVLKPGGHALVWALPRTSHWTATAIENAGFEIRDVHHDILSLDDATRALVDSLDDAQRAALVRCFEGAAAPIYYHLFGQGFPKSLTSKSAAIPEWAGTALKPAVEHWILARKPLDGTVADVHARWGTGVLNIDGCRISTEGESFATPQSNPQNRANATTGEDVSALQFHTASVEKMQAAQRASIERTATLGRWPAHLSLDEAGAAALDEQSGVLAARGNKTASRGASPSVAMGTPTEHSSGPEYNHSATGGASRFFYVAKPARGEKEAGLSHLPASTGGEATGREDDSAGVSNPRAGAGRTGGARNTHPTVKSIALMEWLIKLVTPPGGTVLDLFAGSGTTGVAALRAGMDFIGVEKGEDARYIPILLGRICNQLGIAPPSGA